MPQKREINDQKLPKIITPKAVTILGSYNCTAACDNCCFDCHPGIKQKLTLNQIIKFIDEAKKFKTMKLLVFSGGECFLLGKDLVRAIEYGTKLGLFTRCVTNGYWAKSEVKAYERLKTIKAAGLKEINFSTGDFHQKYVPHDNIINGTIAALELGIPTVIMVELQKERKVNAIGIRTDKNLSKILAFEEKRKLFDSDNICQICKNEITYIEDAHVDHIERYKDGGKTIIKNGRLTHRYCNLQRG